MLFTESTSTVLEQRKVSEQYHVIYWTISTCLDNYMHIYVYMCVDGYVYAYVWIRICIYTHFVSNVGIYRLSFELISRLITRKEFLKASLLLPYKFLVCKYNSC